MLPSPPNTRADPKSQPLHTPPLLSLPEQIAVEISYAHTHINVMEGFRTAEGRMSSRQMPGFTRRDSTSLPDRQHPCPSNNTGQHHRVNDPLPTEWTDEKHCLYLKSMEASFVSDLHNSLDLLGLLSPAADKLSDPRSSQKMHLNTCTSPGQFKVFRGVTWQKKNFDKRKVYSEKSYGSRALMGNSWTQHVRSSFRQVRQCLAREDSSGAESQSVNINVGKVTTRRFSTLPKCHTLDRTHFQHLGSSVDSHTEVSDQNFIGEDIEGERLGAESGENQKKAVAADASNDDQVVPLGNPTVPEDLDRNYVTSGKDDIHQ